MRDTQQPAFISSLRYEMYDNTPARVRRQQQGTTLHSSG